MASEPLAIANAHKHAPVPAQPPDVPPPVAELVYDKLAKTPAGRPASARVVADRADMLREALALGEIAQGGEFAGANFAGVTRADLRADPGHGRPRAGRRWAPPGGPPWSPPRSRRPRQRRPGPRCL